MEEMPRRALLLPLCACVLLASCAAKKPTSEDARQFIDSLEPKLMALNIDSGRADWIKSTYITGDTEDISAKLDQRAIDAQVAYAKQSTQFDGLAIDPVTTRKIQILKLGLTLATPADPKEAEELTRITSQLEGAYGKGKWCPNGPQSCKDIEDLTKLMAQSRDPKELLAAWTGWHEISKPMRGEFARYVTLANKGAQELGFKDNGAMWRAKYDMPPDDFAKELDRLWDQMKPLYLSLHAYVRARLHQKYGDVVPANGPIPAYLLGNMWAQDWSNIYPLVAPPNGDPGYNLDALLAKKNVDWKRMVQYGEGFFRSLGFTALPQTFWERSLFLKPRDRDVVCHASAWDIDFADDVRLKMCIQITGEDFLTIHHELGHNFSYQRAYDKQPFLFRDSANDGFHEAIGDTIALSVTPEYLVKLGLVDKAPDPSKGSRPADAHRAVVDGVPAIWPRNRSVALEGVFRRDTTRKVQRNVVAASRKVSGRRAAARTHGRGLRRGGEVSCRGQRSVHALLPRHSAVSISPCALSQVAGYASPSGTAARFTRIALPATVTELDARDGRQPARGRTRWIKSRARSRWMHPQFAITSCRCRSNSMFKTRESRLAGSAVR